jgi:hypothetical protein
MCWSATSSLTTYIMCTAILAVMYFQDKISIYEFVGIQSFVLIQLVEFALWTFLDDPVYNRFFSMICAVVIFFEPILLFLMFNHSTAWMRFTATYISVVALYLLLGPKLGPFETVKAANGHLNWKWWNGGFWPSLIWATFLAGGAMYDAFVLHNPFSYLTILFVFGFFAYSFYAYAKYNTFGSMWCFYAFAVVSCLYLYRMITSVKGC